MSPTLLSSSRKDRIARHRHRRGRSAALANTGWPQRSKECSSSLRTIPPPPIMASGSLTGLALLLPSELEQSSPSLPSLIPRHSLSLKEEEAHLRMWLTRQCFLNSVIPVARKEAPGHVRSYTLMFVLVPFPHLVLPPPPPPPLLFLLGCVPPLPLTLHSNHAQL